VVDVRLVDRLLPRAPRDHWEPTAAFRRRRVVVAATSVAGGALLRRAFTRQPGSPEFYGYALAVAGVWAGGALAAGPLHLGRELTRSGRLRRPVVAPGAAGVGAFGGLYACAFLARRVPVLDRAVSAVLAYAHEGNDAAVLATTLVNGVAEEVFFRGALYAAVAEGRQVAVSTAAYTATTLATRNPSLVLAAAGMGTLFGLQRRASGGVQAPAITHVVWSALVLRFLPPLFDGPRPGAGAAAA
jgi:membrane protease YdiL (CAAX protease family)